MLRKEPFVTGEYYHLYNRGIDKRIIFKTKSDYERFCALLYIANSEEGLRLHNALRSLREGYKESFSLEKGKPIVSIGVWCLMPNHFHLVVKQEVDGGITKFMRKLGVGYSMFFNAKYKRQGALFGGLFKSKLIDGDRYMREVYSYIHLNPLEIPFSDWSNASHKNKKEMIEFLRSYTYSSYQEYCGVERKEGVIINKNAFPNYTRPNSSFEASIKDYITRKMSENGSRSSV